MAEVKRERIPICPLPHLLDEDSAETRDWFPGRIQEPSFCKSEKESLKNWFMWVRCDAKYCGGEKFNDLVILQSSRMKMLKVSLVQNAAVCE